jgi:hypothetical protein
MLTNGPRATWMPLPIRSCIGGWVSTISRVAKGLGITLAELFTGVGGFHRPRNIHSH